jgi:EF-hand domain-containing family member B
LEDFRDFNHDHLSKVKNLGQTKHLHDSNQIFGKNPKKQDIWNVAQCIRGEATFKQAYEDPQLGKTVRSGFRNEPRKGDEGRVFGVPSIRFDVSKPGFNSVANNVVIPQ